MSSIQRQSILSSLFIYTGFIIGAFNMALSPFVLDQAHIGFTKVINDFSFVAVGFATVGMNSVVAKFYPYYRHFLQKEKSDLLFTVVSIVSIGLVVVLTVVALGEKWVIIAFGRKNDEIFRQFYWTVYPYITLGLIFMVSEPFFWVTGKSAVFNLLKENGFRLMTTLLLVLMAFKIISFSGFMSLYAFLYLPVTAIIVFLLYRSGQFTWYPHVSKVTRRFKGKMFYYTLYLFLAGLLTLLVKVCDTLFIAGQNGFEDAAIFIYALYFSQILDVPNRSISGGAVPVLVEYWRVKNMSGIASIYRKSAMNLMIAGLALGGLIIINLDNAIRFLGSNYAGIKYPTIILIAAQFLNLATGLNATIIHTSSRWRFDFISTMIYSVISIPLNFIFIRYMGIIGAAMATLASSLFYNAYRWIFLYRQFRLQPFSWRNAELLLIISVFIFLLYLMPATHFFQAKIPDIITDVFLRCVLFIPVFGAIVIKRRYAEEVNILWTKWSAKLLKPIKK